MQQLQINHSADLQKLQNAGYNIEISGGKYLLVHHIKYVTQEKKIGSGTLVCILNLAGTIKLLPPADHTIYFQGETPCDADGKALDAIINNNNQQQLTQTIIVNHYFSSKPTSGNYPNYYEKVRTYSEILLAQAKVIDPAVTSRSKLKNINHEHSI